MSEAKQETQAIKSKINAYAVRAFREIADQDYIAARLCSESGLMPQYLSLAQQCIEKYLKAILLFNRIEAKKVMHNIDECLSKCDALPFKLDLNEGVIEFIDRLQTNTPSRYFEKSHHTDPYELFRLDEAVWFIRRYCRVLDYEIKIPIGVTSALPTELRRIKDAIKNPPKFKIVGGLLEKIIEDKKHPSRPALIYKNLYYTASNRKRVDSGIGYYRSNYAPTFQHPEIIGYLEHYIFLDRDTKELKNR